MHRTELFCVRLSYRCATASLTRTDWHFAKGDGRWLSSRARCGCACRRWYTAILSDPRRQSQGAGDCRTV